MQRETIIQLAAEMFVGQGIKAVRMDDIARHIGVSKRTIYEQFGDKEELLYQCLSYYVREQDRRHAELGAQAKNVLEAMLLVFGDVMDKAEISHRLQSNLRRFYPKVYERLVAECRTTECHALVACITADNEPSRRLFESIGFRRVSHFEQVGRKFGRWLDVVDYELLL